MNKIWVGDFRLKDIKVALDSLQLAGADDKYFFEDSAEFNWFDTVATNQFVAELSEKSAVIFMIGLNDCINSCVWTCFDVASYASKYAASINKVIEQHSDIDFYLCSVDPVESDYPFAGITVAAKALNDKINTFNTNLKANCKANYIDTSTYLKTIGFNTRDGVRFDFSSVKNIARYTISSIKTAATTTFHPRLSAPSGGTYTTGGNEEPGAIGIDPWCSTSKGGLSPFGGLSGHTGGKYDGDTLPNCTAYAWGRFYEILGSRPKLSTGNAEDWYGYTADGYERGNTPVLGAVICWEGKGSAAGHVAIVEKINDDGSIVTSESGWNSPAYWWLSERTNENGNWGAGSNYIFQGFIYSSTPKIISKDEVRSANSWSVFTRNDAMKKNAQYIFQYFSAKGWTLNAIAALLGNMEHESGMSPGIWEGIAGGCETINTATGTHTLTSKGKNFSGGYGLVQWTPASKLCNWCSDGKQNGTGRTLPYWDIDSQLYRIDWEARNNKQWGIASYNKEYKYKGEKFSDLTFSQFITSDRDVNWLTAAFAFCYERPAGSDNYLSDGEISNGYQTAAEAKLGLCETRGADGEFWYEYLAPYSSVSVISDNKPVVENLTVTAGTTNITGSFIVKNCKSYTYKILDSSAEIYKKSVNLDQTTEEISVVKFSYASLIPNKSYKLTVEVTANDETVYEKTLDFKIPQDFPSAVESVTLTCNDEKIDKDSYFTLKATKPSYIGYWRADSGYNIQLFVNSRLVSTKTAPIQDLEKSFTIKDEFGYSCSIGDTVQVGIQAWVKDSGGNIIYNNNMQITKTSEPICIINSTIQPYLNI